MTEGFWASSDDDKIHFYTSKDTLDNGTCLCGKIFLPIVKLSKWDESHQDTCEECRKRLDWMKYR